MITVNPSGVRLSPDPQRVIAKPFLAHAMGLIDQGQRLEQIVERLLGLTSEQVASALALLRSQFRARHRDLEALWEDHLEVATAFVPKLGAIADRELRLLLGASFTQEYAIEGAALTNPSAVPLADGRFILSLRAIGEGHISSVEFRHGSVSPQGEVTVTPPGPYARAGTRTEISHDRSSFASKLSEMEADDEIAGLVLEKLPDPFTSMDLTAAVAKVAGKDQVHPYRAETTFHLFRWLATSNYDLTFDGESLSERVLFPAGPADSRGMEDARFVRFVEDDGSVVFYATYTAFDGFRILPQLITTKDFNRFRVSTLHGSCAQNKGMALFPRRIDGRFLALSRHDQTNLYISWTDDLWQWNNAERLTAPHYLWEAIQIGTCGSPLETEEGWLVITHGVGPMRTYRLGALLLDRDEPDLVIGRLDEPLLEPDWGDRDGYVPNVVYSCGALLDGSLLVLPYGIADREVGIGVVEVSEILKAMV